jgi:hypothetical protein
MGKVMVDCAYMQVKDYTLPSTPSVIVTVIHDDLLHPILGGNKLRKLDALLPTLQADGVTDVVRSSLENTHLSCVR